MLLGHAELKRRPACLEPRRVTDTDFAPSFSSKVSSFGHPGEEAMPERSICLAQAIPAMFMPRRILGLVTLMIVCPRSIYSVMFQQLWPGHTLQQESSPWSPSETSAEIAWKAAQMLHVSILAVV
jgi:hypothetical protein